MATTEEKRYMQMAIDLAEYGLDSKKGGLFGAIIVREGKIVGCSSNCVMCDNDPTAHAEMMAIKDACKNLETLDLAGCTIYSSGEPCPMCLAAIYWSRISKIFYANSEDDALEYGFVDKIILQELKKPKEKRMLKSVRIDNPMAIKLYEKALTALP